MQQYEETVEEKVKPKDSKKLKSFVRALRAEKAKVSEPQVKNSNPFKPKVIATTPKAKEKVMKQADIKKKSTQMQSSKKEFQQLENARQVTLIGQVQELGLEQVKSFSRDEDINFLTSLEGKNYFQLAKVLESLEAN